MCLAVPGKIVTITEAEALGLRRGRIDFGGVVKEACLAYTPEASVGDYVLVHVGFALAVIDEAAAQRIFDTLREMEQLEELKTADGDSLAAQNDAPRNPR
ncbi:MAG TPA: HypC/HybG/HupF family hydrogenase formation chaperone [Terriglobia bacterium]|nr:HypC/HybG/HupF family hydrogenase formation chaperone [Terriglobia bacterium]